MEIKHIRRRNLVALIGGKTQREFAEETGMSDRHVSQLVNGFRQMGDVIARRIEEKLRLPRGWMDASHAGQEARQPAADYGLDLVTAAEIDAAIEKFRRLHPAFREYIAMKMDQLLAYSEELPGFIKKNLQAPTRPGYYEWERDLEADMARLKIRDRHTQEN